MPDQLDDELRAVSAFDLSGGQNDSIFPTQIADTQAELLRDVDISTPGKRVTRNGYTQQGATTGASRVRGLADFSPEGGTHVVAARAGTRLYTYDSAFARTEESSALANDVDADLIQAQNLLMILQGSANNVYTFDGTSVTDEGNTNTDPPRTTHGLWMQNRLWLAGSGANPLFLWYSSLNDPQTFDRATNVLKFDEGGGDAIVGMAEFGAFDMIVFTNKNTHVLNVAGAASEWTRSLVNAKYGCIARRSVARVGSDIWFLGADGHVRSLVKTENDKIRGADVPMTDAIDGFIRDNFNFSALSSAVGVFFDNAYWLAVPVGVSTVPNNIIKIDTLTRGVTVFTNYPVSAFMISDIAGSQERLYFGHTSVTEIFRADNGTSDDGTTITHSEKGKRFHFGLPHNLKTFVFLDLLIEAAADAGADVIVRAQVDGGGYTEVLLPDGTRFNTAGGGPTLPVVLPFVLADKSIRRERYHLEDLGRGYDIQVEIESSDLDIPINVLGYTVGAYGENLEYEEAA